MSIEDRLKAVKLAEIKCEQHAVNARNSWQALKTGFKEAATPWRIVGVGAITGFLAGRRTPVPGAPGIGNRVFGTIAQTLITAFGASMTAGAAAGAAADAAAVATTDAVENIEHADARIAGADSHQDVAGNQAA